MRKIRCESFINYKFLILTINIPVQYTDMYVNWWHNLFFLDLFLRSPVIPENYTD